MVKCMNSQNIDITEANLPKANEYISKQFRAHSWWPREQPGEAKREFELMKGSASTLNVWCGRWLDGAQRQKLQKSIQS